MKICSVLNTMLIIVLFVVQAHGQGTSLPITSTDSNPFLDNEECIASGCDLTERFNCMSSPGMMSYDEWNESNALSGLSPKLPIFKCTFRRDLSHNITGMICTGGFTVLCKNYIVRQGNVRKIIRTEEEFRSLFAPVETPEEAIAFAVALTDSFPLYNTSPPQGYYAIYKSIQPTHAERINGAFKVHLFEFSGCDCDCLDPSYYAVDYIITKAGQVSEISSKKVYDSFNTQIQDNI